MKIGVMFGSPETTTGGNALKFYASVRLDIRRIGSIKEAAASDKKEPVVVGNRTRVKVVKNKMAPPFREVEFDILYGQGISRSGDAVDLGSEMGIIEKSGAWFSFGGERIGQGRENAKTYLEERPALLEKIERMILQKHNIKVGPEREQPAAQKDPHKDQAPPAGGAQAHGKGAPAQVNGAKPEEGKKAAPPVKTPN
jgi:recombination protein RecA